MNDNRRQHGLSGSPDAAAWFVMLQRRPHDADVKRDFEAWLAEDPKHADDWASVSSSWDRMAAIRDEASVVAAREALAEDLAALRRPPRMRWAAGIAAMAVLGGAVVGLSVMRHSPPTGEPAVTASLQSQLATYVTPVGGQKTVVLQDGSKVTLSTDTEVLLTEWDRRRALTVTKGEAFFEVAKNPDRPFVVTAAGRTVTALGTAFDVRVDPGQWSVSLLEGKIRVRSEQQSVDLTPGSHLVQSSNAAWSVEQRNVGELTSWREGSLVFANRPLGSIVAEMNRYSVQKMRIDDARLAATPLSGRFKTGDVAGFVATLQAYGVAQVGASSPTTIDLHPAPAE